MSAINIKPYVLKLSSNDVRLKSFWSDEYQKYISSRNIEELTIHCADKYVSDGITKDTILSWRCNDITSKNSSSKTYQRSNVFINAQTGKGKNYFILKNLIDAAQTTSSFILYISNRVALDSQFKQTLSRELKTGIQYIPIKSSYNVEMIANVFIIKYQDISFGLQHRENIVQDLKLYTNYNLKYVILDECHFFYSDSSFNPDTACILENILINTSDCIHIFMSATLDSVYEYLSYHSYYYLKSQILSFYSTLDKIYLSLRTLEYYEYIYRFKDNYSNYNCYYFSDPNEVMAQIKWSQNDKWIFFVKSIEEGRMLEQAIKSNNEMLSSNNTSKNAVIFLKASDKYSDENSPKYSSYQLLLEEGKFRERVLITTSFLDNGFSIKDPDVKNIVLFTDDKTEFMQELGRCRLTDENQKINVYISKVSSKAIKALENRYNEYYGVIRAIWYNKSNKNNCSVQNQSCQEITNLSYNDFSVYPLPTMDADSIVNDLFNNKLHYTKNFFRVMSSGTVDFHFQTIASCNQYPALPSMIYCNPLINWCAKVLKDQIDDYRELESREGSRSEILFKARWLHKESDADNPSCDISLSHNIQKIINIKRFLEQHIGESIDTNKWDEKIYKPLKPLIIDFYIEKGGNRSSSRNLGYVAINGVFKHIHDTYDSDFNYNITYNNKKYEITKSIDNDTVSSD